MTLTDEERKARKRERNRKRDSTPERKEYKRNYMRNYSRTSKAKANRREYESRDEVKLRQKTNAEKLKLEVYSKLSKRDSNSDIPCCNCCGENSDIRFLVIDHVYGRSHLPKNERKLLGGRTAARVKKNGYPDDYQILCWNCNEAKMISKDNKCPHQR